MIDADGKEREFNPESLSEHLSKVKSSMKGDER